MTHKPYISASETVRELSLRALGVGIVFSLFFAVANAYLGLKIGQTISASIPAAILSLGLMRVLFRNVTILEHNIIQTIATMGEGTAGGLVFALPALLFLGETPSIWEIFLLSTLGGILGILFMIPMRRFLIVEEHAKLPYPEGTACAQILMAGTRAGKSAIEAARGAIIGLIYKIVMNGCYLWNEIPSFAVRWLPGATFSVDGTPALLGVGYLIGSRISFLMLGGGILGWFVLIPLITSVQPIPMSPGDIWATHIRYIGAGAVATGGMASLFKIFPLLIRTFREGWKELFAKSEHRMRLPRTDQDISMKWLIIGAFGVASLLWILPLGFNLFTVLLLIVLSFLFIGISSITVGLVGSSSSPISGMIVTVLLITCITFVLLGWTERVYLLSAIMLSIVSCVSIGLAGNTSQDLKTGFLLGATPRNQQIAQLIGVFAPSLALGSTIYVLNEAYTIGSTEMPAPQGAMLAMIASGVIAKTLPFALIGIGISVGVLLLILGIPVLPFAIGLYLPLSLSVGTACGGLAHLLVTKMRRAPSDTGVLFASGLVGGDAVAGIAIALLTVWGLIPASGSYFSPDIVSVVLFALLGSVLFRTALKPGNPEPK